MKQTLIASLAFLSAMASAIAAQEADYTQGILWVNEDWYGHQNSTVNYLLPDDPDGNFWRYSAVPISMERFGMTGFI